MVPPASHKLTGVRGTQDASRIRSSVLYGTLTPSGGAFQRLPVEEGTPSAGPTTPVRLATGWFGLFPSRSPLLRESHLISLRRATEMFQFAHCPPPGLCIHPGVSRHHSGRVAPFGLSGLIARMQLPLNVSPVSASFFGLQRLGIHLVLFFACASFPARSLRAGPHSRVPLLLVLSCCLGNIEVIMFIWFVNVQISCPRQLKSGNQPAD